MSKKNNDGQKNNDGKKNDDGKKISYDVGNFKLIKSDVNLNSKNFIGYDDNDYETISNFNNSDVCLAIKDNTFINKSLFVGYEQQDIIHLINVQNDESSEKESPSEPNDNIKYTLDVKGDAMINGNAVINDKLFVGNSVFFNKDIFLPNPYILNEENISSNNELDITEDTISYSSYKFLLKNILDETKNNTKKNISSIKFVSDSTGFTQSIIPINKKFIFNKIKIYTFLLTYFVFFKNKIIEVKPIMDTFILVNESTSNVLKLTLDKNIQVNNENNDE